MSPKVSIIIPTKNRRVLLAEAIASVRCQTYENWEAIVVDDGSNDGTAELMATLSKEDVRIRFLTRDSSTPGAPARRNQGFFASTGDYIVFLDDDDCLAPSCLVNRVSELNGQPDIDFLVSNVGLFKNNVHDMDLLWNIQTSEGDIDRYLILDVPWSTHAVTWRRQSIQDVGMWDESILSWQDWELCLRALIKGFKYKRSLTIDCYYREPGVRETIGTHSTDAEHLHSQEIAIAKVWSLMLTHEVLSKKRVQLIAGLYMMKVWQWLYLSRPNESNRILKYCYLSGFISFWTFHLSSLYFNLYFKTIQCLRITKVRYIRGVSKKLFCIVWRKRQPFFYSKTYKRVPISVSATWWDQ